MGKTSITLSLAYAMMQRGARVLVLDADLGMANVEVLLGTSSAYNLLHVIRGMKSLRDVVVEGPRGLRWIPGGSGVAELADLTADQLHSLVASFGELDATTDVLLIDTGAGISRTVTSFIQAADEAIVICTPEPTSITDAYGVIKTVSAGERPIPLSLLVNRAVNDREAMDVGRGVQRAARRFLNRDVSVLGYLPEDPLVARAVRAQQPFFLMQPSARVSRSVDQVAAKLIHQEQEGARPKGLGAFIKRFASFFE
ncbi:MAG: MinD/ParA family protein [Armatimonadetes bacterium]|nr:MinD/ParA family protein [Armatimonadota bacterium]